MIDISKTKDIQELVSIIIPAHNAEKWIKRSLMSALQQTYKNIEVIVIENGSTDETWNILKRTMDNRVIILQSEKGVSNARNKGIDEAKGEYLTFLDADDWLAPDAVEKMVEYMEPCVDIVSARYFGDKEYEDYNYCKYNPGEKRYILKCLYAPTKRGNSTSILYRSSFIKCCGIRFDPRLSHAEDSVFFFCLLMHKPVVVDLEEPVYHVFVNFDSTTRSNINIHDFCLATERIYHILSDKDDDLKNGGYIFALNQLLVIMVHSGKKGKNLREYIRKVCSIDVFKRAIHNSDIRETEFAKRVLFNLMKKKSYTILALAISLRIAQNKRRGKE